MNEEPFISIIVPVYNAQEYICKCIESILQQQSSAWELILVDDGSKDLSAQICDQYAAKNNKIKVIHQKNRGQGNARNRGTEDAIGKWLMFIDDDDWIEPTLIMDCFPLLRDDIDIFVFGKREVYTSGQKDFSLNIPEKYLTFQTKEELRSLQLNMLNFFNPYKFDLYKAPFVTPWGKFIRNSFWKDNNLRFIEGYGEDRPCLFRAYGCARKVVYYDKILYNYYIHESTMRKYLPNALDRYRLSLSTLHNYVMDIEEVNSEFSKNIKHTDIAYFSYCVMQDYCHRANPQEYRIRKQRFLKDYKDFKDSFKSADFSILPLDRRIVGYLIKLNNFAILNFACKLYSIIRYL